MLITTDYKAICSRIRLGDVITFSGSGWISAAIRFFTRSVISHAVIMFEILENDTYPGKLMESIALNGQGGVQETYLNERIASY